LSKAIQTGHEVGVARDRGGSLEDDLTPEKIDREVDETIKRLLNKYPPPTE
jgi:hypothetical protein